MNNHEYIIYENCSTCGSSTQEISIKKIPKLILALSFLCWSIKKKINVGRGGFYLLSEIAQTGLPNLITGPYSCNKAKLSILFPT